MKKEWKEVLWEMYLQEADYLGDRKERVMPIGEQFFDDVSFLYEIYPLIGTGSVKRKDRKSGIVFETGEGDSHLFRLGKNTVSLSTGQIRTLTADMTGLFEEVLPIGSIVDLRKDVLGRHMDVSGVENFRVAVVKRFMEKGERYFYPYGAVVYPVGNTGKGKLLSFSSALIERIVFAGYSDEIEEAFIFQKKQEFIIRQHRRSAGLSGEEEKVHG